MTPPSRAPRTTARTTHLLCSALLVAAVVAAAGGLGHDARAQAAPATASAASVTQRPCFGAAARDRSSRCRDASLRLMVFPSPQDALLEPNGACRPLGRAGLLNPCGFGTARRASTATVALIGDSHASAWRPAVAVVAQERGWPAVSITRAGCAFSAAQVVLPAGRAATCRSWNHELLAWLKTHPEVSTVFLATRANAHYVPTRAGRSNFETAVAGHLARWRALPATVKHVFVIRDTPYSSSAAAQCVRRESAARRRAGVICARVRGKALHRGPAATAARRLRSARVRVLDLTPFFCGSSRCYPVVGGALVHKDTEHITATFATTLGRFLLARVDELI